MEIDKKEEMSVIEREIGVRDEDIEVKRYFVLIKPFEVAEKTKGGVILPDSSRSELQNATAVGIILKMGDMAFMDYGMNTRFPNGPLCKVGDVVEYSFLERFTTHYNKHKCYYISDERIISVIKNPEITGMM